MEDNLTPQKNAEMIAGRIAWAELALYDNVGHGMPFQIDEIWAKRIIEFLEKWIFFLFYNKVRSKTPLINRYVL